MAINKKPQAVGLSDPKLVRQATTKLTQDAIAAQGKPAVIQGTAVLPRTTVQATATSVNVTTSANNQVADTTTIYRSSGAIYVSSIDQTIQQVTNKNIVNQVGVSQIIAGNNMTITSSVPDGVGIVTINAVLPTYGNVAVLNLDGNAANVLHGDGSWSADITTYGNSNVVTLLGAFGSNSISTTGNVTANVFAGNGSSLTAIAGGNVSGAVGLATYATTANAVAGANVSGEVSYAATANAVAGGNVSGAVGLATYATTANAVAGANVSGFVANANVANSALSLSNGNSSLSIPVADSNVIITSNGTEQWIFADDSTLYAPGNAVLSGSVIAVGPGANTLAASLADPTLVISSNSVAFIQAAINNVSDIGSADWVAYGHHGNDAGGWADLGFTSAAFGDANYTITGPGDGYVFAQGFPVGAAPAIGGGNLILATGFEGSTKDIIFGTGGFGTSNIFGRISHANNALELSRAGSGITVAGGNISGANVVSANYFVGNGANLSAIAGGNVSGAVGLATYASTANAVAGANVSGEVSYAATANAVSGGNVSGAVGLATYATTANAVAGANVSGEVSYAATANAVAGANVSGAVGLATYATTANAVAGANVSGFVANANVANTAFLLANGNSNVNIATANGNITLTATSNTTMTITDTGANITGTANISGNITAGNVTATGLTATGTITANGGVYGEVVTTQFASVFGSGSGPNPQSIMQVRGSDGVAGMGIRAYTGLTSEIYANTGVNFTTGSTIRDKDSPTGGTLRATIDSTGLTVTGIANISGNITGGNISTTGVFSGNAAGVNSLVFGNITTLATASITTDELYLQGTTRLEVTNSGSSGYVFDQYGAGLNPTLYARSGDTLAFNLAVTGHPFLIRLSGANYSTGLSHVTTAGVVSTGASAQGQVDGTLYWKIPYGITGNYQYQCSIHGGMLGIVSIADGNIANASVATAGTVTSNAQSNITSVGTLSSLSVTGNVTGGNISTTGIVNTGVFNTGNIPAAATAGAGARVFVTDADSITFKAAYVGGSGNAVPVFSDGSAWYVG